MKSPAARKSAATAAANFKSAVQTKTQNYVQGVNNPGVDWAGAATSEQAIAARNAGLQAAMANKTIEAGIEKVGNSKWRANAANKGGATWSPQSAAAAPKYQQAMGTVESDWNGATAAAQAANTTGGFRGRMAGQEAFNTYMHNAARARKGLPAE